MELNGQINAVVQDLLGPIRSAHKFKRLWKHGTMYQCIDYQLTTKRNSYTVEFSRNGHLEFGEVQYFLKCSQPCEHSSCSVISCNCNTNQYIAIIQLLECNQNKHSPFKGCIHKCHGTSCCSCCKKERGMSGSFRSGYCVNVCFC